jgi:hypothetical protein
MLIHKIFHLRQPISEAREWLLDVGTCNERERDFEMTCSTVGREGIGRLEFRVGHGELVTADIEEVLGDDPNRILFRSVRGAVELAGMIELFPIRPNLTEAVLTVEYEAKSPVQKALEAVSMALDGFINRQLARIEVCGLQRAA